MQPNLQNWYPALKKPIFTPPNFIFGPVWILLYISMALSAIIVFKQGIENKDVKIALVLFAFQLVPNLLWSYLFFSLKSPFYALIDIIVLWVAIVLTVVWFFKVNQTAGWIMVPYLVWVSFASYLNIGILLLNK